MSKYSLLLVLFLIIFLNFTVQVFTDSCRNTVDFCILTLNLETLLNSLFLKLFFVDYFEFPHVDSYVIVNVEQFCFFCFQFVCKHFPPLFSLIALARTSSMMLNKSGENGYPCLVPDLKRKAFSRSLLNIKPFIKLKMSPFGS